LLPTHEYPGNWIFYISLALGVAFFIYSVTVKVMVFSKGKGDWRLDKPLVRLLSLIPYLLGNSRVARRRYWYSGALHTMIFWGFIVLQIRTFNFFLKGFDNEISLEQVGGTVYDIGVRAPMDLFNILVVVGVVMAAWQRVFWKPARLTLNWDAWVILSLIAFLMISDVFLNSFEIATDPHAGQGWSFAAYGLAQVWDGIGMSRGVQEGFLTFWWYAHLYDFLIFLNFLPYSKHSHVLTVPFNIAFRRVAPTGQLQPIRDFETAERFGAGEVNDLTWKQMLDPYTCTECGRCEINCPAFLTGKELSPKKIMHDMRTAIEQEVKKVGSPLFVWDALRPNANGDGNGSGGNGHGDGQVQDLTLIDAVGFNPIWDCVTCGACQYQCPVFIEHVPALQDMRRFLTMNEANMPETAAQTLMQLEQRGHPWRGTPYTRTSWMEGLDVPTFDGSKKYLYWVGCSGALVDRNIPTTRAVARLLKEAGVSFGCLGEEESCTGDPARRLGNEYLYQTQATSLIEVLKAKGVKRIITNCPHCFNTMLNEYPHFEGEFEVIHHSSFLAKLVQDGALKPKNDVQLDITYHDSCYLGRHNDNYDGPRDIVDALPGGSRVEMPRNRENSFCCGAGGSHMWVEETKGKRINVARTEEAYGTGAQVVATACPFCVQMFEDGIPTVEPDEEKRMKTYDVAELLELSVLGRSDASKNGAAAKETAEPAPADAQATPNPSE
jgi:Fe-S oxidoreductase